MDKTLRRSKGFAVLWDALENNFQHIELNLQQVLGFLFNFLLPLNQ